MWGYCKCQVSVLNVDVGWLLKLISMVVLHGEILEQAGLF